MAIGKNGNAKSIGSTIRAGERISGEAMRSSGKPTAKDKVTKDAGSTAGETESIPESLPQDPEIATVVARGRHPPGLEPAPGQSPHPDSSRLLAR